MVTEGQPRTKKDSLRNIVVIFLVLVVVGISVVHLVINVTAPVLPLYRLPIG